MIAPLRTLGLRELWALASASGWACAAWRRPESSSLWFLACRNPRKGRPQIVGAAPGFVVAPFEGDDVLSLEADILVRWDARGEASVERGDPIWLSDELGAPEESAHADAQGPCEGFAESVDSAKRLMAEGLLQKVVLSRTIDAPAPAGDPIAVFQRLSEAYPGAFCAIASLPGYGLWMGASPELLLAWEQGRFFRTIALAGTRPALTDLGQIAWSQKEIEEQALVSRYIISQFKKIRLREFEEDGPRVAQAGPVVHLRTDFTVDAAEVDRPDLPDTMLDLLHPTSAVCGMPRDAALEFIHTHERHDRELYSGYWGPVAVEGDTHLFVNLRCLRWDAESVRLFVGAGITHGSDPAAELAETEIKADTLRSVLGD